MSRRARWSLLLSCCGLAALLSPSAWRVLAEGPVGSPPKASVGVTPAVALALTAASQPLPTALPEAPGRVAPSHPGPRRPGAASAGPPADPASGAEALAQRAR